MDDQETTLTVEELVASVADIVSKNGNLLLGLGPKADGSFPELQVQVVKQFGEWMNVNGEAIYGSRPYTRFAGKTNTGNPVQYTAKDGHLYAIFVGSVQGAVAIKDLKVSPGAEVALLGVGPLERSDNGDVIVESRTDRSGCVLKFNLSDVQGG
jgi:alpha-L-fucosidase